MTTTRPEVIFREIAPTNNIEGDIPFGEIQATRSLCVNGSCVTTTQEYPWIALSLLFVSIVLVGVVAIIVARRFLIQ